MSSRFDTGVPSTNSPISEARGKIAEVIYLPGATEDTVASRSGYTRAERGEKEIGTKDSYRRKSAA
jgi:hypothetical protein